MTFEEEMPSKLRVLCVHNSYQHAGGEDSVFRNEASLLEDAGHTVKRLCVSNDDINSVQARVTAAGNAIYSRKGKSIIARAITDFAPDVVHVHNFFPQLSPAIFDACIASGVASVWTLHNFRVACANGLLFRDGNVCEECVGRFPTSAVRHRCYRDSYLGTAAVALMIGYHSFARTWHRRVNRFIALNSFAREKFIASGLPEDRIVVKPNFSQPVIQSAEDTRGRYGAVYVGRLSTEKGLWTLIKAWNELEIPLTIFGDGPERVALQAAASSNVTFAGFSNPQRIAAAMSSAEAVIIPSLWYENFPMTVVEAMAAGTPVIASRIGALTNLVENGVSGFHFEVGDSQDLARVVKTAFSDPDLLAKIGEGAFAQWKANLSPEANLKKLIEIYHAAMSDASK